MLAQVPSTCVGSLPSSVFHIADLRALLLRVPYDNIFEIYRPDFDLSCRCRNLIRSRRVPIDEVCEFLDIHMFPRLDLRAQLLVRLGLVIVSQTLEGRYENLVCGRTDVVMEESLELQRRGSRQARVLDVEVRGKLVLRKCDNVR